MREDKQWTDAELEAHFGAKADAEFTRAQWFAGALTLGRYVKTDEDKSPAVCAYDLIKRASMDKESCFLLLGAALYTKWDIRTAAGDVLDVELAGFVADAMSLLALLHGGFNAEDIVDIAAVYYNLDDTGRKMATAATLEIANKTCRRVESPPETLQ